MERSPSSAFTLSALLFGVTVLGLVVAASWVVWRELGQIDLGFHGWVALILGSVAMVALGCGLMWLSFYSSRSGHDSAAHYDPGDETD
ncbi:hypothetical protein OAP51_00445 [Alphaproteobacteria bacterium]|nr:hypothetical protein [Alphaproteobacteria bacterium]